MHIPVVTGFYAGLLGLWLVFLTVRVAKMRGRVQVSLFDGRNRELGVAIRQHGNFTELVPMCLILIAIVEMTAGSIYLVHALGIALVVCRLLHPFGLNFHGGTWQRFVGTSGTLLVLSVAACWTIYTFVAGALPA